MDQEFRDDGTVICPVHGLRFDPNLTTGCIKCPRTQPPPKRSTAAPKGSIGPRAGSVGPSRMPPSEPPPSRLSSPGGFSPARIGGRPSTPPLPFEPADVPGVNDPHLKIIAAPPPKYSRRGLFVGISATVLAGVGVGAWLLRPPAPTDWSKKVKPLAWTSAMGPRSGSFYAATRSETEPCPLLVALDPKQSSANVVTRYARHAERHGWIVASTDSVGKSVGLEDVAEVQALVEQARATMNVNATRVMLAGFGPAGDCAYRVAVLEPATFGGAIAECCGIATWRDVGAFAKSDTAIYLVARSNDRGRDVMLTLKDEMERRGVRVTFEEIAGGHEEMAGEELEAPFLWLDAQRG